MSSRFFLFSLPTSFPIVPLRSKDRIESHRLARLAKTNAVVGRYNRPRGAFIDDLDALVLVEKAKREAADLLAGYEQKLARGGRFVEVVQLGIIRFLVSAPVDFLERVDALKEAVPEMDRVRARETIHARLGEWKSHLEFLDRVIDLDPDIDSTPHDTPHE